MKTPVFTGTCTALITPFLPSGAIDYETFARQIDRQLEFGVDALCVCGTTGESATLTTEEHVKLVDYCVAHVAGQCKVLAGSGSNSTETALYLCQHAQESGADALLLVTPYYNKTTKSGLVHHYEYLADQTDLPIILYNVPSRTGLSFTAETYQILSQHPRINGIKEASDFSGLQSGAGTHGGADPQLFPGGLGGGKGAAALLPPSDAGALLPSQSHSHQGGHGRVGIGQRRASATPLENGQRTSAGAYGDLAGL